MPHKPKSAPVAPPAPHFNTSYEVRPYDYRRLVQLADELELARNELIYPPPVESIDVDGELERGETYEQHVERILPAISPRRFEAALVQAHWKGFQDWLEALGRASQGIDLNKEATDLWHKLDELNRA